MTQVNKICLNFETGEEVKDVKINLDNSELYVNCQPYNKNELSHILEAESNRFIIEFSLFKKSQENDPIFQKYPLLLELQKKLGFDVYGEYVVFENKEYKYKPYEEIVNKLMIPYRKAMNYFNDERANIINYKLAKDCTEEENIYFNNIYCGRYEFKKECDDILKDYGHCFNINDRVYPEAYQKGEIYNEIEAYQMLLESVKKSNYSCIKDRQIKYLEIIQELSKHYRGEKSQYENIKKILDI